MSKDVKLLIVDDDPDYVEGIQSTLINAGYAVDAAYNPKLVLKPWNQKNMTSFSWIS